VHNIAKFEKAVMTGDISLKSLMWDVPEKATMTLTGKTTQTCHWKGYDDMWHITKKLWLRVAYHWKGYNDVNWIEYSDVSLKMLWWRMTCHWKDYSNMSLKRLPWRELKSLHVTYHLKSYDDGWHITENAIMTGDISLKRLTWLKIKIPPCVN
jgi:hypothetical protein